MMRAARPALWLSLRGVYVLLGLLLLLGVAAFVPRAMPLFWLGALVFAALVVADVAFGPGPAALRLARGEVAPLALRRTTPLTYTLENRSGISVRVRLFETPIPTLDIEPGVLATTIAAGRAQSVAVTLRPTERGPVEFGTIYCTAENAIGLLTRRFAQAAPLAARVFPDFSAIERYGSLAQRRTLLEAGLRKLRERGLGNTFESLREHVTGDSFRAIDWKATARRGKLMVAQYEVERSQHVIVALDCGRLMVPRIGPQRKFDYALTAALSVARIAQLAGDEVGLVAFAARPLLEMAPRRGARHVDALMQASFALQPRMEEPDYETVLTDLRRRYAKRSLIVLFTDLFDPANSAAILAGVATLVPRHLVLCVLMNDAEIEQAIATEATLAREAYRASVAMKLRDERARSLSILRSRGVLVVDVPAPRLTVALLDSYLDIKGRGLI